MTCPGMYALHRRASIMAEEAQGGVRSSPNKTPAGRMGEITLSLCVAVAVDVSVASASFFCRDPPYLGSDYTGGSP